MRELDDYFFDTPDKNLYHYTGIGTLLGIADKRELWSSHIYYMNDAQELKEAYRAMERLQSPNFVFGGGNKPQFLSQFRAWMKQCVSQPADFFIFSLSEKQSLLSQWRSYTPHGKGVSICFSPKLVQEIASENNLKLAKCVYTLPEQCELIEVLLNRLWKRHEQENVRLTDPPDFFPFFDKYKDEVVQVMALIKHDAFVEEHEWRLISKVRQVDSEVFFREGQGASMLTPYIKLKLRQTGQLFDFVVLGPTPHQELALHSLQSFLQARGLSNFAVPSEIPYREW